MDSLHPNLARLAASYDRIIEQMQSGLLSPEAAREQILALEDRDDQGVRWMIDPDTGQFVRKTAFGTTEYDTPPKFGLMTPDAYAYSAPSDANPASRMSLYDAPTPTPPTDLAGATQRQTEPKKSSNPLAGLSFLKRSKKPSNTNDIPVGPAKAKLKKEKTYDLKSAIPGILMLIAFLVLIAVGYVIYKKMESAPVTPVPVTTPAQPDTQQQPAPDSGKKNNKNGN